MTEQDLQAIRERYTEGTSAFRDVGRCTLTDIGALLAEVERLTDTNKALESSLYNAEMNLEHITDELEQAQRWVSVTERLPERPNPNQCGIVYREWYLVCLRSGCVKSLCFCFEKNSWHETGSPVTHWQQLPEPPKEDTK